MSAAPIVVGGEALYDLVAGPGDDADTLTGHAGGGPFNVARTIGRLRQPVAFLGRLSTDRLGATHARMLTEDGVGLECVVRSDDPTTLALASVDDDGVASYGFYTAATAAAGLTPQAALAALPQHVAALHVGTLGLVLEPLASAMEAVVERLAGRTMVVVDPNCRPQAIADPAPYRARLGARARAQRSRQGQRGGPRLAGSAAARRSTRRARCSERARARCCSRAAPTAPRC